MANGWINLFYYRETDSTFFHKEGIKEYHLLFSDPKTYVTNIFYNYNHGAFGGVMDISESFWNNLKSNVIIKLLSVFNIFSNTHYFINALFYNFLVFFGSVALYRLFKNIAPQKKFLILIASFLLPSTLYFSSGIHREGLIFLSLSMVCFSFNRILIGQKSFKLYLTAFFSLAVIFIIRNFVFIALIPALLAWFLSTKIKRPKWIVFAAVYVGFIFLFFGIKQIFPGLDLPKIVANRQAAFIKIAKKSHSEISSVTLQPTFKSFAINTPKAFSNVMLKPTLFENITPFYIPLAMETILYLLAFLVLVFFPEKSIINPSIIPFSICFSISMFLMIGYTIPILGALVRYRSIYFPFFIIPIILNTDIKKLKEKLYTKKF